MMAIMAIGVVAVFSGCTAALVGGAAGATGVGTYVFLEGELSTDYYYSFDRVWAATERVVAQLKATEVKPDKKIGEGSISCVINGQKVWIKVLYKEKNITTVGVRVGITGDERASKMIHGLILDRVKA